MRNMTIPQSLQGKINSFKSNGTFVEYERESFLESSWLSMYNGFNIIPDHAKNVVSLKDLPKVNDVLKKMSHAIQLGVGYAPSHQAFLRDMGIK